MKIFLYMFVAILFSSIAVAQWVKTNGPEGGPVSVILNDATSGYIFAGGNGFYRSSDNGSTWSEANVGMEGNASPVAIIRSGSNLFAGSLDKVYVSSNNGDSWTPTTVPAQVLSLGAIGNTIVAGTNVFGVYWSTDNGVTWTAATGFQPSNNIVQTIATYGTKLLAGLGGKGVWASTDSGKTWSASYSGTVFGASHSVNGLAVHGSKIFAANSDSGVFVSNDGGSVWIHSASGMNPRASVKSVISNSTTLYAHVVGAYIGVDTGVVYRSTDNGATWVSVRSDLYSTLGYCLGFGAGKVFYSTWAGIYASTNDGGHWFPSNSGLSNANALSLTVNGSTLFAGHTGGVAKTEDGGASWAVANNGIPGNTAVTSMTTHNSYVFASIGNGVLRSSDNGATWVPVNSGLTGFSLYTSTIASGGSYVYVSTFGGMYTSADDGGSWTGPGTGLPFGNASVIFVDGDDVWAGFGSNGVYYSSDHGSSWTASSNGLPPFGRNVMAITRNGSTLYAGLAAATGSSIYISTDNGANWTASSAGIPSGSTCLTLYSVDQFVFAGFNYSGGSVASGIYRTSDNGANWESVSNGLPGFSSINAIAVIGPTMYGSYLGVWKRPLSEITSVKEIAGEIPTSYSLSQNYPNPFNPSTNFEFRIANFELAKLSVFDVLGKKIATLVNEHLRAGTYNVSWDASEQPSGVYYYRLSAGSFSQTKKLLLMK